jgi:hypothetical protein
MYCIICGNKISHKIKVQIKSVILGNKYTFLAPVCLEQQCIDDYKKHRQYTTHHFSGFCNICGKKAELTISGHGDNKNTRYQHPKCKMHRGRPYIVLKEKKIHRHPLKPWDDPESLFCSPKLKEIIGKEPKKGNGCK